MGLLSVNMMENDILGCGSCLKKHMDLEKCSVEMGMIMI